MSKTTYEEYLKRYGSLMIVKAFDREEGSVLQAEAPWQNTKRHE